MDPWAKQGKQETVVNFPRIPIGNPQRNIRKSPVTLDIKTKTLHMGSIAAKWKDLNKWLKANSQTIQKTILPGNLVIVKTSV